MSIWQAMVALVLEQLNPMYIHPLIEFFVYRLVEFATGKPVPTESFLTRWLPTALQTIGLRSDHAQLLSMNIYATWLFGCVVCLVRNAICRVGRRPDRGAPANPALRTSGRKRHQPGRAAPIALRAAPRRRRGEHRLGRQFQPLPHPTVNSAAAKRAKLKERGHGLTVSWFEGSRA